MNAGVATAVVLQVLLCLGWTATGVAAYSDAIGVNLSSPDADDISAKVCTGYVAQVNWNNARNPTNLTSGSTANLTSKMTNNRRYVPGLTSSCGINWNGGWIYGHPYFSQPSQSGLAKTGWQAQYGATMTVGGIPFSNYDVAVLISPWNDYNALCWTVILGQSGPTYTYDIHHTSPCNDGAIFAMQILSLDPGVWFSKGGWVIIVR